MPFCSPMPGEYVSFLPRFSDFIVSHLRGGIICLPAEALTGVYIRSDARFCSLFPCGLLPSLRRDIAPV